MSDKATGTQVDWAVELLAKAEDLPSVQRILRSSARAGVQAQGATVVLLDDGFCFYVDEDAMSPLWKGQRFPVSACISGWSMINRQSVVVPDIGYDTRIPQDAYRPTFVRSLAMVPIRVEAPLGAIGAYWANRHVASAEEIATLERLADAAGDVLARILVQPAPEPVSS
jgi:GAF domain-containing protein